MRKITNNLKNAWQSANLHLAWIDRPLSWSYVYLIMLFVSFIYILPILLANVYFQDDFMRSFLGKSLWGNFGRFGADIIAHTASFSNFTTLNDPGQFFQIACVPVLAVAGLIAMKSFVTVPTVRYALPFIFIVLNPFFLTNLSYRYDSLGMTIAYALSIGSFYLLARQHKTNTISTAIFASVLIFLSTTVYQSMPNVFMALCVLYIIYHFYIQKMTYTHLFKKVILFIGVYIAGFTSAILAMGLARVHDEDRNSFSFAPSTIMANIERSSELVMSYFTPAVVVITLPLVIIGLLYFARTTISAERSSASKLFMLPLLLAAGLMTLIGPLVVMEYATILPRTHTAFAILLVAIVGLFILASKKQKPATLLLVAPLVISIFSLSGSYANYIKMNDEHRANTANLIANDLRRINDTQKDVYVGGALAPPVNSLHIRQNIPLLKYTYGPPTRLPNEKVSTVHVRFGIIYPLVSMSPGIIENVSSGEWRQLLANAQQASCGDLATVDVYEYGLYTIFDTPDDIYVILSPENNLCN